MRDFSDEPAQLTALINSLGNFSAVVTFNGRAFDLPLLRTRLILARLAFPLANVPHLDLLWPARRLWRESLPSCALSSLEQYVLGVHRASQDVPGYMIPSLYFDYLRTGDASPLVGVFYHNVQDILSQVTLAVRMCRILEVPFQAESSPCELLGIARMYERAGLLEASCRAYASAVEGQLPAKEKELALRRLSYLFKRIGRREEAVAIWNAMLEREDETSLYAYTELAKHYEWVTGDIRLAAELTERATFLAVRRRELAELEHRLNRLRRKLNNCGNSSTKSTEG